MISCTCKPKKLLNLYSIIVTYTIIPQAGSANASKRVLDKAVTNRLWTLLDRTQAKNVKKVQAEL